MPFAGGKISGSIHLADRKYAITSRQREVSIKQPHGFKPKMLLNVGSLKKITSSSNHRT
jgi:hypothetical protein